MKNDTLHKLGKKFGTDKVYRSATSNLSYLDIYEDFFLNNFNRDDKLNILEIGVRKGSSIRMLLEFFPNASIYGFDINKSCNFKEKNFTFINGNQDNITDLKKITDKCDQFNIIIDDGSHEMNHYVKTFEFLIDYVRPGGLYIIEDLYNNYMFWQPSPKSNHNNPRYADLLKHLSYKIHQSRQKLDQNPISNFSVYPGLLLISK